MGIEAHPRAPAEAGERVIQWVRQEHTNGCVIASLAMISGKTYREVHDDLAPQLGNFVDVEGKSEWRRGVDFNKDGMAIMFDGWGWLADNGFAIQQRYKFHYNIERPQWPLDPWADVHLCSVVTTQSHAVVLLRDGRVLDPLTPEPKKLSDYSKVESMMAVYKVSA